MISRVIANFPTPYQSELFYHTIARAMAQTTGLSTLDKKYLFFGKDIRANLYYPFYIFELSKRSGDALDVVDIIQNHSIYPYYNLFLPEIKQKEFLTKVLNNRGRTTGFVTGQRTDLDLKSMRYCPCCLKKQKEQGLPLYPRKEWQLPGIEVCPYDHYYLKEYPLLSKEDVWKEFLVMEEDRLSLEGEECFDPVLIHLSEMALELFNYPLFAFNKEDLRKKILVLLRERDYYYKDSLSFKRFHQDIYNFYSQEWLEKFKHSSCDGFDRRCFSTSWIGRILSKSPFGTIPLQWLLLINFFDLSLTDFLNVKVTELNYFPPNRWKKNLCLNPFCYGYKNKYCKILSRIEDSKTGTIRKLNYCPYCKMVYTIENEEKITIIQKGDVWFERYEKSLDPSNWPYSTFPLETNQEKINTFLAVEKNTEFTDRLKRTRSVIIDYINNDITNNCRNIVDLIDQVKKNFPVQYEFLKENDNINFNKILLELTLLDHPPDDYSTKRKRRIIKSLKNLKSLEVKIFLLNY